MEKDKALNALSKFSNFLLTHVPQSVYLRGFGSFIVKKRAEKKARNISKNTTIVIPEHYIPSFRPSKKFVNKVKENVK